MTIGERIKELRAEANLRQSELGKAIGFSAQVVSNVERG
jgi:transcriptional regulator with XRE-family HTH domain